MDEMMGWIDIQAKQPSDGQIVQVMSIAQFKARYSKESWEPVEDVMGTITHWKEQDDGSAT